MNYIAIDIETIGDEDGFALQPFRVASKQASISAISVVDQLGNVYGSHLKPTKKDIRKLLKSIPTDATICGWNFIFDLAWLYAYGFQPILDSYNIFDGYLAYRQLNNVTLLGKYGLKAAVAKRWPELTHYADGIDFKVVNAKLLEYNKQDAYFTAVLCAEMSAKMTPKELRLTRLVSECSKPFAKAWIKGFEVDPNALYDLSKLTNTAYDEALAYNSMNESILRSPKQLKEWIKVSTGIEVESTNKLTLAKLTPTESLANIQKAKKASTIISKVINTTIDAVKYTGPNCRVYPSPRLFNTYTGRVGYENRILRKHPVSFPLHQMPRDIACRRILIVPEGYKLVEFDFAGQEARLIADYSGDTAMVQAFQDNIDLHSRIGAAIAGRTYDDFIKTLKAGDTDTKQQRLLGKIANLALQYRMSAKTLINTALVQNNLQLSEDEAYIIHRIYRQLYPGVVQYWSDAVKKAKQWGYAETRGGRRVYLDWSNSEREFANQQTAINFPIQGTGADMKYLALSYIHEMLSQYDATFMFDLHDGLYYCVQDEELDGFIPEALDAISNLPYLKVFGWRIKVPFPVECKYGQNWGDMK